MPDFASDLSIPVPFSSSILHQEIVPFEHQHASPGASCSPRAPAGTQISEPIICIIQGQYYGPGLDYQQAPRGQHHDGPLYKNLAPDSAPELLLKNTASERPPLLADRSPECHGAMTCRLIHDDAHHARPQLLLFVPGSRPANQSMHERPPYLCLYYRHMLLLPA